MLLKILKDSDPILKRKSEPVKQITEEVKKLAAQMLATMKLNNGIGLAAPQVGHSIRMIVYDVGDDFGVLVNPEILTNNQVLQIGTEGCLSFPSQYCEVERYQIIEVKYMDLSGKIVVKSFVGLIARIVQHEVDHLNGITMLDRQI